MLAALLLSPLFYHMKRGLYNKIVLQFSFTIFGYDMFGFPKGGMIKTKRNLN